MNEVVSKRQPMQMPLDTYSECNALFGVLRILLLRKNNFLFGFVVSVGMFSCVELASAAQTELGSKREADVNAIILDRLETVRSAPADQRAEVRRVLLRDLLLAPKVSKLAAVTPTSVKLPNSGFSISAYKLLDFISGAEAGDQGYNAVQLRARILPPKPPTKMTLAEIRQWIEATPGQQHAIGRYQIIPSTLEYLIHALNLRADMIFDQRLQDKLAMRLLEDAGLNQFRKGLIDADSFMDEVAFVWAGLPLKSGFSAYHGFNGNRATVSRAEYEARFKEIFQ
jgi:hypothetical protein